MTIAQQLKIKDFPFVIRNKDGNIIYYESPNNYWSKHEYDADGNEIYYESSDGFVKINRPKTVEVTLEEISEKFGISIEQLRIKD